ncbi:MAG: hypothetical protein ABSA21_06980 [Candidatus Limnocylindrales bacterium]
MIGLVLGLVLGLAILVVAVAVMLLAGARSGGRFERIARCRAGHLFTSTVVPGASLKAVRLGRVRFQRWPVGGHWTLVSWVNESTLTPDEIREAHSRHDIRTL